MRASAFNGVADPDLRLCSAPGLMLGDGRVPARTALLVAAALVVCGAPPAAADSLLYRCDENLCRVAPDGSVRKQLTTDGRPEGPAYSWLSASRDGSRMAVSKATYAYVLDGSGRQLGEALPRGGIALVAQISPDGTQVATLELLGETQPPPVTAPPGSPPTLGFIPYMFVTAADGSGRESVARSIIDTAWVGRTAAAQRRLLRAAVPARALPAGHQHELRVRARRGARPVERPVGAGGVTRRAAARGRPLAGRAERGRRPDRALRPRDRAAAAPAHHRRR